MGIKKYSKNMLVYALMSSILTQPVFASHVNTIPSEENFIIKETTYEEFLRDIESQNIQFISPESISNELLEDSTSEPTFGEPTFGGFIKNRLNGNTISLRCAEKDGELCKTFQFFLISGSKVTPINSNYNFTLAELQDVLKITQNKMQTRVNPAGNIPNIPYMALTFTVLMLVDQNRAVGKKQPLQILYVFTVPVDLISFFPVVIGAVIVWAVRLGIIGVQKKNLKAAIAALEKSGKIKKINNKNFNTMINVIESYKKVTQSQ